jgi:hypothetical protein
MEQQPQSPLRKLLELFYGFDEILATKALDEIFPGLYLSSLEFTKDAGIAAVKHLKKQSELDWNSELIGVFALTLEPTAADVKCQPKALLGTTITSLRHDEPQSGAQVILELTGAGHYRLGIAVRKPGDPIPPIAALPAPFSKPPTSSPRNDDYEPKVGRGKN